jgi:hypothetical protein
MVNRAYQRYRASHCGAGDADGTGHKTVMTSVFPILFGAALTIAACLGAGRMLLARTGIELYRGEWWLCSFVAGSPVVSLLVFILATAGWVGKVTLVALALLLIAVGCLASPPRSLRLPDWPNRWKLLFAALFIPFTVLYLTQAVGPEYSPDGSSYHLGLVSRYLRTGGFAGTPAGVYAGLSQGLEMLFLMAFAVGRHSAAALVHFAFLLALAAGILSYALRFGSAAAGAGAALLVYLTPVIGGDGTAAYNDVAVACVVFFVFYLLEIWDQTKQPALLIPIGLLAGFAYAIKYTAAAALPFALVYVFWRRRRLRPVLTVAFCAALLVLPWTAKNLITAGNPVSPFFNRWFPNPYTNRATEEEYTRSNGFQRDGFTFAGAIPDMTLRGHLARGLLGPVFLLSPFGLLALWDPKRKGRRLLAAAAVFTAVWPANIDTRFLIPAVPFAALALCLVLARAPALLALVLIAHACLSWPTIVRRYCHPLALRVQHFLPREALRIIPEDSTLDYRLPGYAAAKLIDRVVPAGSKVFAFSTPPEAYSARDIFVYWQSSFNESIQDVLLMPLRPEMQPLFRWSIEFPRRRLRALRIVQDSLDPHAQWSVGELRVWNAGKEWSPGTDWKLHPSENPWDAVWALDHNPLTRWRSLRTLAPGLRLDLEFPKPHEIDAVTLDGAHDQWSLRLHVEDENGRPLPARFQRIEIPALPDLRAAAVREIARRGITHLLMRDTDFGADDFRLHAAAWGITPAGTAREWRLYRLQ